MRSRVSPHQDPALGRRQPGGTKFGCEHALAAAVLVVVGVAVLDAFSTRFSLVGRSIVAATSVEANAQPR